MITHRIRFIFHVFIIAIISTYFWTQSRYPDLNRKAMMAKNASVADTISMYPIFEIKATDPLHLKIAYTTANWVNDNKKGMTFGVVIGSLFLSLIGYLRLKPTQNKLVSAFYGTIMGSPLGVCVNCAAPIFKGVLHTKQLEFSFAMMLSSPTLNMIVLTMVFSLFPLYMAVTKVLFTLMTIFVVVPVLSHFLAGQIKVYGFEALSKKAPDFSFNISPVGSFFHEIGSTFKDFGRAFSFLALRTVPLMFVAGFLGSLVSHAIPFEMIGAEGGPLILILTAFVGLFLPVPMAFDVVLTNALFVGGLSPSLALILLCTLGIFSSYSFMIVWSSASRQWAFLLAGAILVMGISVGFMGNTLDRIFYLEPNIRDYQVMRQKEPTGLKSDSFSPDTKVTKGLQQGASDQSSLTDGEEQSPFSEEVHPKQRLDRILFREEADLKIWSTNFLQTATPTGRFEKHEGVSLGLENGFVYGIRDYPDPFWIGRGTASGDIDQDGWIDVIFGSDTGPKLYKNLGGGRFSAVQNLLPQMDDKRVYAVALIDWNNDGWLDLFMTTFHRGNFVALNNNGDFKDVLAVPNGGGILTVSPAIADFNADGWLDVYNGNMALGIITGFRAYGTGRQNSLTFQIPGEKGFREKIVDVIDGETMSTIASDINGDGFLDIYAGNDFVVPDYWFLGQKSGEFVLAPREGLGGLPTPFYSMSVETGDLNNDLITDFISTGTVQMARGVGIEPIDGRSPFEYTKRNDTKEVCEDRIDQKFFRDNCILNRKTDHLIPFYKNRNLNIRDCLVLTDPTNKDDCLLSVMWMIVTSNVNITNCKEQFGFDQKILEVCELFIKAGPQKLSQEFKDFAPQQDEPHLYVGKGDNQFTKQSITHPGGWTWSTKFADFDRDGYLDIFNAEGVVREGGFGFNVLLQNQMGQGRGLEFVQRQFSWNLTDPFYLFSFTLVDYDHDGDLDIIGNSSIGPVQVYENRLNSNSSIGFGVRFPGFNTHGVSARLTIEYQEGRKQVREIKAGGGYQSFDAPRAYFGLGSHKEVKSIKVSLMGKEKMVEKSIEGPFPTGAYYELDFKNWN